MKNLKTKVVQSIIDKTWTQIHDVVPDLIRMDVFSSTTEQISFQTKRPVLNPFSTHIFNQAWYQK